ncbi:hypothetical protein GWI33_017857 [Rhynchophorus ferrugineus]|uniref:CHK kinase-like domain-containing protein n=1 Tax=Rhynchophorus ferrugineus TaxID=354439 RepID=A0A834HXS6_RHYFE|nr:hypothetical protein GWI33_017857 [Rhynchophorus ferrugineus]
MTPATLFDPDYLNKTFSLKGNTNITISEWQRSSGKLLLCETECECVKYDYILTEQLSEHHPLWNRDFIFNPDKIIQSDQGRKYLVFEKEKLDEFVLVEKNNREHLTVLLDNLVTRQTKYIRAGDTKRDTACGDIKNLIDNVLSKSDFGEFDKGQLQSTIDRLQNDFNELVKGHFLVRSFFTPEDNAFVKLESSEARFLQQCSGSFQPPLYETLSLIFSFTDENFRQRHFKNLISRYFTKTKGAWDHFLLAEEIRRHYDRRNQENHLRVLLPVVKLQLMGQVSDKGLTVNLKNFWRCPLLNQEDVYEVLHNKLDSDRYELHNYELSLLSEKNGHLGQYYRLNIEVKHDGNVEVLRLFAKFLIAPNETGQQMLKMGPAVHEDFFYNTLVPFYASHDVDTLLNIAPRCYLTRLYWVLILDDLREENFESLKPDSILDYPGLKSVVEVLAEYHAASFTVEAKLSQSEGRSVTIMETFPQIFKPNLSVLNLDQVKTLVQSYLDGLKRLMTLCPDVLTKYHTNIDELLDNISERQAEGMRWMVPSEKHRNAVKHGDVYAGNMMFKPDPHHPEIKLVDFQTISYGVPTFEVLSFIYLTSSKEIRNKFMDRLLNDYYETLARHLRDSHLDPDEIYPRTEFNDSLDFIKYASVYGALRYAHLMHLNPRFREEMFSDTGIFNYYMYENRAALIDAGWSEKHYRSIMQGLLEDLIELIVSK